jgi:hypothetical protein
MMTIGKAGSYMKSLTQVIKVPKLRKAPNRVLIKVRTDQPSRFTHR